MTLIMSDDVISITTAPDQEFMSRASESYILRVLILCSDDQCTLRQTVEAAPPPFCMFCVFCPQFWLCCCMSVYGGPHMERLDPTNIQCALCEEV